MPVDEQSPWKEVLPLVIESASKSAEASAASAAALSSFENRVSSLEAAVNTCGDKLTELIVLEEERKARDAGRSAWARSIITPQFLAYLLALLLALAGFRVTMPGGALEIPPTEVSP